MRKDSHPSKNLTGIAVRVKRDFGKEMTANPRECHGATCSSSCIPFGLPYVDRRAPIITKDFGAIEPQTTNLA